MTRRAQHLTFAIFAAVTVASLMTTAYLYGKTRTHGPVEGSPETRVRTKILLGRIARIEPLHIYVESAALGPARTYDVIFGPETAFVRLIPWAPGEREKAIEERMIYIKKLDPKPGDPVPPPTQEMKLAPLDFSTLVPGAMIVVVSNVEIDPAVPIVAAAIRPLTPEEAAAGQVSDPVPSR